MSPEPLDSEPRRYGQSDQRDDFDPIADLALQEET